MARVESRDGSEELVERVAKVELVRENLCDDLQQISWGQDIATLDNLLK